MTLSTTQGRARPGGRSAALGQSATLQSINVVCAGKAIAIAPSGGRSGAARASRAGRLHVAVQVQEGMR